ADEFVERAFGMPIHLRFAVEKLSSERGELPEAALDSIPFHSLCRAIFLPLSSMAPAQAAQYFGIQIEPPPDTAGRAALLLQFFGKEVGLTIEQKLGAVLGDPFLGRPSSFRRDSLVRLLLSVELAQYTATIDRLNVVGDVAVLFA